MSMGHTIVHTITENDNANNITNNNIDPTDNTGIQSDNTDNVSDNTGNQSDNQSDSETDRPHEIGLYFYNINNEKIRSGLIDLSNDVNKTMYSEYFDENNPTLILFHGWSLNHVTGDICRDFMGKNMSDVNYARIWKDPSHHIAGTEYRVSPIPSNLTPDNKYSRGNILNQIHVHKNKNKTVYNIMPLQT